MRNKLFVMLAIGLASCGALGLQTTLANPQNEEKNIYKSSSSNLSELSLDNYNIKAAEVQDNSVKDYDTEEIDTIYGIDESQVEEKIEEDERNNKDSTKKTTHTNISFDEWDENYEELEITYTNPSGEEIVSDINTETRDKIINGNSADSNVSYSNNDYTYSDLAMSVMTKALKNNKEFAKASKLRQEVVLFAMKYIGNKYVYGGNDVNNGIDCSAFTKYVMGKFGVELPRTSYQQRSSGESVSEPGVGDLICYSGHVAIYIGDGQIIHASNSKPYPSGGIKVSSDYRYRTVLSIRSLFND